jgi:hypothetical protein
LAKRTSINSNLEMHKEKEMAEFRKYILALALVALFVGLSSPASAQVTTAPFQCSQTTVPNNLRAEGMTEMVGDIVIDCSGGTPLAAGTKLPFVNITVATSAPLTSKITASIPAAVGPNTNFDEALLIVDDPNTPAWAVTSAAGGGGPRNILNCGNPAGAPDTDPASGAGICAILAPGNQVLSYDGTLLSQPGGAAACAGTPLPTPIAGTGAGFGCGRPNVFQGRQDLDAFGGLLQQRIVFLSVPIDQPGTITVPPGAVRGVDFPANCDSSGLCHHTFRITNIRVNAATVGTGSGLVSGTQVFADLTVSDSHVFPLTNAGITSNGIGSILVGRVNTTLLEPPGQNGPLNLVGCQDTDVNVGTINYEEIIADAWKPRNISLILDNNRPGPGGNGATGTAYVFSGGPGVYDANDCYQNVPGVNFETEAGFQNSLPGPASTICPGGTPPVNPPNGIGTGATPRPANFTPFSDGTANCSRTGIACAGIANTGTRLVFTVQNIFGNNVVEVDAPAQVFLKNRTNGAVTGIAILQRYGGACNPTTHAENVFCPAAGDVNTEVPLGNLSSGLCTRADGTTIPGSTCTSAVGFYEIVYTNPGVLETMTVQFHVHFQAENIATATPVNPAPVTLGTPLGYGPNYDNNAPQKFATLAALPSGNGAFPYPRFVQTPGPQTKLFAINGKCVCNLLFPYATDAQILPGSAFDTGIAIANTSRDPGTQARRGGVNGGLGNGFNGAFGFTTPATAECEDEEVPHCHVTVNEQQGPVQFWYFNTQKDTNNNAVNFGDLGNGPQGNTQCTNTATPGQCNDLDGQLTLNTGTNVPAGGVMTMTVKGGSNPWGLLGVDPFVTSSDHTFTGYIIAQASFQYCHGTAFITTNGFGIVPGLNIPALSYQALQLDAPDLNFRTTVDGESLDH